MSLSGVAWGPMLGVVAVIACVRLLSVPGVRASFGRLWRRG